MKPNKRGYGLYLDDMLSSMHRIDNYIKGLTFEDFRNNYMVIDAVIRNFEIIGEAAKNIPKDIQDKYSHIPWNKMYGLRNLISHEYFGIDHEMIWEISQYHLPQNAKDLKKVINDLKDSD